MKKFYFGAFAAMMLAALCMAGCKPDNDYAGGGIYTFENAEVYSVGGSSVSAEGIAALDVDWVAGQVDFVTDEEATEISFTETYAEKNQETAFAEEIYRLRYFVDGSTLRIRYIKSGENTKSGMTKQLTVTVPASQSFTEVKANNISGDVTAYEVNADSWTVQTVSGRIFLVHINPSELYAESMSGDVIVGQGTFGTVSLKTSSGAISFENSFENSDKTVRSFKAETVSGDVRFWSDAAPLEGASIESVSGDVKFLLSAAANFTLTYRTTSGTVYDAFGTTADGHTYVAGTGSSIITVNTVSGGLELQRLAEQNDAE